MAKHSNIGERRNTIAKIVLQEGSTQIKELAEMFQVTTETIRKDLTYLEEKGVLTRSHGGALSSDELVNSFYSNMPVTSRLNKNIESKNKIAEKALEFLPKDGNIFLDPGSTVFCLAKLLKLQSGLNIFTNAINVASLLSDSNNTVHVAGGRLINQTSSLNGLWTINCLESVRIDVAFIGSSGVMNHNGPTSDLFEDSINKKTLLKSCKKTILLMDSSKFLTSGTVSYGSWDQIDYLITDNKIPIKDKDAFNVKKEIIVV